MKTFLVIAISSFALFGCHKHEEGEHHDHDDHGTKEESGGGHGHSHGADAKSFSGATHKEGQGITLLPETKERLDIKLDEVREEKLPYEIAFTARIYAVSGQGEFEASGVVSSVDAKSLTPGSAVKLQLNGTEPLEGVVARASKPVSTHETELIVRFTTEASKAAIGSFVRVSASVPSEAPVTTIPREALIKGTTESFVYVENGDAYLRTVVEPGRATTNAVEIRDGLLEGDLVVSKGAMDLWLVELRAVKGGQGCCPAPPVKGKGK